MNKQKDLWEKLAKKNSKYFINSDHGKGITEEQFRASGAKDVEDLILSDKLIDKRDSILEIGCGNGRMTEFLFDDFKTIIGTDISGEMIKQAKDRLSFMPSIKFIETNGFTLPIEDNSVDLVFSYIVFQHMKTKAMVESNFKEAYRVLKPGGMFKVRVRTDNVSDRLDTWWAGIDYTRDEAVQMSKTIGFEVLKTEQVKSYGLWLWLKKN